MRQYASKTALAAILLADSLPRPADVGGAVEELIP